MNTPPLDPCALERIAQGDGEAVREMIDMYGDLIWSLARRFTQSDAEAEEAVHDIFVTLWRKACRYDRSQGAEVTFVSVLARRQLIDRWRRASRRPTPVDLSEHHAEAPASSCRIESDELAADAANAFSELENDVQVALRLSIEFGLSHATIAEMTGTPLGTVKSRIRNGLRQIRDCLSSRRLVGAK